MDTRRYLLLPLLALIMAGSLRVAHADDFNPFTDSDLASQSSTLVFLSEVSEIASGEPFHVLFKLTHPPNWHSYFINPGYVGASLLSLIHISEPTRLLSIGDCGGGV